MRHGKKINHLSRTAPHRKAMLSNMASSLILHKRISTTLPKAKALRKYVEPLITKSKSDSTHSRRTVFSYLQSKESVNILFDEVADKVATRPGGYTRIIRTGSRAGDNAEMCIIELVDYNELLLKETETKTKTRRSRRGGKKSKSSSTQAKDTAAEQSAKEPESESADQAVIEEKEREEKEIKQENKEQKSEEPKKEQASTEEQVKEVKDEPKAEAKEDAESSTDKGEEKSDEKKSSSADDEEEEKK